MNVQRPVIDISDEKESRYRLNSLELLLKKNQQIQKKLVDLLESIQKRKKQLEEFGLGSSVNEHKKNILNLEWVSSTATVPLALENQKSLKKSRLADFKFTRNIIIEPNEKKAKKLINLDLGRLPKNAKQINFVEEAEKCSNFENGLEVYKTWRKVHYSQNQLKKQFDRSSILLLLEKKRMYGDNWQKICYFFNGYTFQDLYYFYQRNLTNVKPGRWTLRENIILVILSECYGKGKWALISKIMKVKSQFQVRERFCNILDPSIMTNKWERQDEELLLKKAKEENYEWSKIVKNVPEFSGKTDNALRRKFRSIMCKHPVEEIRNIVGKAALAKSIIAFKNKQVRKERKQK